MEKNLPPAMRVIPLETDDAQQLSTAICNVARHYPMMIASQKYIDIGALIAACGSVYIPMMMLYRQRQDEYTRWLAAETARRETAMERGETPI